MKRVISFNARFNVANNSEENNPITGPFHPTTSIKNNWRSRPNTTIACYTHKDGIRKETEIFLDNFETLRDLADYICREILQPDEKKEDFEFFVCCDGTSVSVDRDMPRLLSDIGLDFGKNFTMEVVEKTANLYAREVPTEDDLVLGASASPTTDKAPSSSEETGPETEFTSRTYGPHPKYNNSEDNSEENLRESTSFDEPLKYVGLVNQAMTCYLNSLVQSLFMTPEFRNAIYNWEFDGQNETRSIPYQLQKLFLNLQTSNRSAVETTDLTTSFGWQGSEAWHQHDIQELCRVMFDALERKFKDTEQANLINDLYEGTMLDYVKCLECGTEKSRDDTFLDIPLPVRPFGSAVAYNSVEEALRAFVQPETLDGNNQYHCEKCEKKCDAHKGLKFIKFPYLLTLHLKRFDFDYNTMHRIKLNDKVVFSEKLNLNSFVPKSKSDSDNLEEIAVKCDDCSTTDSGSALDDESCQGTDVSASAVNEHNDDNCEDIDEGIDVSSGNVHNDSEAQGPYNYELFSIMIHSGSASGGHYYAFIKDLDKNNWLCFNDQIVSRITEDDIRKTYGGGPQKGYYSGVYTSSTNAYMLMYRQIDPIRNAPIMAVDDFPKHIKHLLELMKEKERNDLINKEKQIQSVKLSIYCTHPISEDFMDIRMTVYPDTTLREGAAAAHRRFKLDGLVDVDDCRLVVYNKHQNRIDYSFDDLDVYIKDLTHNSRPVVYEDWYLEIKEFDQRFAHHHKDEINVRVYHIMSLDSEHLRAPFILRIDRRDDVRTVKMKLAPLLDLDPTEMKLCVQEKKIVSNNMIIEPRYIDNDDDVNIFDGKTSDCKIFISSQIDDDVDVTTFDESKLCELIKKIDNLIHIRVFVPDCDPATIEKLSIPPYEESQCGLAIDSFGDQSNSEDSSLSDSDRTLVGDVPDEVQGIYSEAISPVSAEPSVNGTEFADPTVDCYDYDVMGNPADELSWDGCNNHKKATYFRVTDMKKCQQVVDLPYAKCYKILIDNRMTLETFKKLLEPLLRVPKDYFKVNRHHYPNNDEEWSTLSENFRQTYNDQAFGIKLGRALLRHEHFCKVYLLKLDGGASDPVKFLFEHVVKKFQEVGMLKKEILAKAKKQQLIDIPFNKARLREKCTKKPRRVYLDNESFNVEINITNNFEIFLQELQEPETVNNDTRFVLFVRHWCPSTLTLQPFQEVVLKTNLMSELIEKLSELSEIPIEFVEVAITRHIFPADMMHLLDIHTELEWNLNVTHLEQFPLQTDDGSVFFYRDKREVIKELTPEERSEITLKENTRLGRNQSRSCVSSERSLRILSDNWPSDVEDNSID